MPSLELERERVGRRKRERLSFVPADPDLRLEIEDRRHGVIAQHLRRRLAHAIDDRRDLLCAVRALHRHRHLPREIEAIATRHGVELAEDRRAALSAPRVQIREHERRAHAVLVAHDVTDRVAERLLVAHHEALSLRLEIHRAVRDPLEAGERLFPVHAVRACDGAEHRGADDRAEHHALAALVALAQQVVREQAADVVARELHVAIIVARRRDREAIGIRIVGDDEVRLHLAREREHDVHRALLFRVREANRRERAVGLRLRLRRSNVLEAAFVQRASRRDVSDAVHRGVRDREITRPLGMHHELADRGVVRVELRVAERAEAIARGGR